MKGVAVAALVASALTVVSAGQLGAQEIQPGLRIRSWVTPPGEWHAGTLVRYGIDSLVFQPCPDCAAEGQPWAHITRVEVSEGRTWSGRNTAIGFVAGGVIAAVIHTQKVRRDVARCHDGPCGFEALEIPIVGLVGAIAGGALGALWRVESWREIYGEPARD